MTHANQWTERRTHHKVRAIFTQACTLLAPHILDSKTPVSGFTLAHMVKNHFPDLSDGDVHVLISTALRMREEQRLRGVMEAAELALRKR